MPGVPDFYQGTEFWDLSLVDPDNRRPVDFAARAAALASLEKPDWDDLAQNWPDGHLKLAWTRHLLKLRTELADVFAHGDYQPLRGERAASRPCHRLCAAPRPRRRDRRGREIIRRLLARRPRHGRSRRPLTARSNVSGYPWRASPRPSRRSALLAQARFERHLPASAASESAKPPGSTAGAAKPARQAVPSPARLQVANRRDKFELRFMLRQPSRSSSSSAAACRVCGSRPAPPRQSAAAARAAPLPP